MPDVSLPELKGVAQLHKVRHCVKQLIVKHLASVAQADLWVVSAHTHGLNHQADLSGMAPQHASQLLSSSIHYLITGTRAVEPSYKSMCIALNDSGTEAAASCQLEKVV